MEMLTCIDNDGYEVSLILGKKYEILPDTVIEDFDMVRVIDETGESYIFPKERFKEERP